MLKGTDQQEDIILVNIYVAIQEHLKCKADLDGHKGRELQNTVRIGDFNTPLTSMGRSSRKKINKEMVALKDTLDKMNLINIFRAFHPKEAKYTFFSSAHGTFLDTPHLNPQNKSQ